MDVVLDSWALLAVLQNEPSGPRVAEVIEKQQSCICSINLGEAFYIIAREHGDGVAVASIERATQKVEVVGADWSMVLAAARLKVSGGISYADAFCVATASRYDIPLYTGDPEIAALSDQVEVVDLRTLS